MEPDFDQRPCKPSYTAPPIDKVGDEHSYRPNKRVSKKILQVGHGTLLPKAPSIVTVAYKGYITATHELFDETEQNPVKIVLGDQFYPEGFTAAVENMKKGEVAEVRMSKKYGFVKEEKIPEKLKAKIGILKGKGLSYEIKLLDTIIRMDLNGDKRLIKTVVKEGIAGKIPGESDEVKGKFI